MSIQHHPIVCARCHKEDFMPHSNRIGEEIKGKQNGLFRRATLRFVFQGVKESPQFY